MRRLLVLIVALVASMAAVMPSAYAGSPHFVAVSYSISGNTLTVVGKEAGLGDEAQVDIVLAAEAICVNGGGKHPRAVNKTGFANSFTIPVQNGKANFTLSGTATFSPECSPPMTVQYTSITVTDVTNGISVRLL